MIDVLSVLRFSLHGRKFFTEIQRKGQTSGRMDSRSAIHVAYLGRRARKPPL
jgi:hypothetical protein